MKEIRVRCMTENMMKTIFKKVVNSNGVFSCDEMDITVEEWKKVLQDKSISNNHKLWLTRFYQENEHKATCKYMGDKYKCHPNVANATIKNFAEITQKILNRFEVQGTDGKPTYWVIPMKKGIEIKDLFEWTMRDELVQALEELGMTNPEDFEENINFWSGGIYWGKEKKFEEFSTNNYWQIGWDKNSDTKSAIDSWKNIQKIQIGDLLSFHGYGGKNDLTIYQISKVIDKNEDEGKLLIEKINKKDDVLFHDKAPKMEKGGWFGTLFQVTGEEAINKIFGNYIQGDTQMTDYEKKLDEIKNNLLVNRNVILTGAPGTGKTFMAKTVAARIILEREINDFDKDLTEEEKKQVESQTDFVQFHPSYDYTDFVEGLRPKQVDGSDQIGFERKDGVFKAFCEKGLKESYRENNDNVDNFEECWKKLVDELNENDFVTIPLISGKGDFRVELNEYGTGLANRTYENDDYQKGKWIQGKSKFFSKDQLYNIYQGLPGTPAGGHDNYRKAVVEYMKKNLGLLDYKKTESTQKTKKNFVFIIDEINRGEVAKIFGELFYCIDPGYRGEKGRISTQYQNLVTSGEFQKGFFIPENVYIIGTMNDIDRSVESMDFAFRRRFSWIEVKASDTVDMLDPKYDDNGELIAGLEKNLAKEAKRRMENLNAAISKIEDLNDAYHIGASYFLKLNNYDGNFGKLWDYHIKGILTEYLRGNPNAKEELDKLEAAYDREEMKDGE